MDGWNTSFPLGRPIFRCYVSFREGRILYSFLSTWWWFRLGGLDSTHDSPVYIEVYGLKGNFCEHYRPPQNIPTPPRVYMNISGIHRDPKKISKRHRALNSHLCFPSTSHISRVSEWHLCILGDFLEMLPPFRRTLSTFQGVRLNFDRQPTAFSISHRIHVRNIYTYLSPWMWPFFT